MKGDKPADRDFGSRTRRDRCARCEGDESRHGDEAAYADLGNFRRFPEFFRPQPPEDDRAGEKTYRHNRVKRDQPGSWHRLAEEDEICAAFCPDKIGIENLLVADDCDRQHRQKKKQRNDRHLFAVYETRLGIFLFAFDNSRIGRKPFAAREINRETDQHADARRTKTILPADFFAQRTGD